LTACSGTQQRNVSSSGGTGDDATCHIEVVEYCDLGNLTSAIRSQIFNLPPPGTAGPGSRHSHTRHASRSSRHSGYESGGGYDSSTDGEGSYAGDSAIGSPASVGAAAVSGSNVVPPGRLRVNMRWLLLTLLEVAEGMAYLHRMGVVHCDLKPANVSAS
jgi:serine/threonine protein kinase